MTTIKNIMSLMAAVPTLAPTPHFVESAKTIPRGCGEVNVFYTGLTPYHPYAIAQGWDPERVEFGLRNQTVSMVEAGYNVHIVWAGPEVPISTMAEKMDETGVEWDMTAIGFGVRGSTLQPIVERFEDLVDLYERKTPNARKVYNHSPESMLWSAAHRMPMTEDCVALGKPGKLLGYEEICDSRCDHETPRAQREMPHDEL